MREAVGGSILFYIILGFLAVFIIFIALIMNYAASYRASNYVLTMLERTEGQVNIGTQNDTSRDKTLYGALHERNYYNSLEVCCVENMNGAIYKIQTVVNFELPMLGLNLDLPIRNETKTIYNVKCNYPEYLKC